MLPLQTNLILNLIPGGSVRPAVKVSQNDTDSRTVVAQLYHGSTAISDVSGVTASVSCTAPDGQEYTLNSTLSAGNPATATFTITEEVTGIAGFVDCELVLMDGDKRIGSGNFWIKVEAEPGAVASAEYESIKEIKEATERARKEIDSIQAELMNRVSMVEGDVAEVITANEEQDIALESLARQAESYTDALEVDPEGLVYLLHNGERIAGPYGPFAGGGGGGGGGGNNAVLTVTNTSGFVSKTIAEGDDLNLTITWSSIEDEMPTGNGTVKVSVNGATKYQADVAQGIVVVNAGDYVSAGGNVVKINISDIYGNNKTVSFNITSVAISISSTFDSATPVTGAIVFPYTPVGAVSKTIYFAVDGTTVSLVTTSVSGRNLTQNLPAQRHGAHTLEVWFECIINGQEVESNHLYYEVICIEEGNTTPIIASSYNKNTIQQYDTVMIPYSVYTPDSLESALEVKVNGNTVSEITVDRTQHVFSYRAEDVGTMTIRFKSGSATKNFSITVEESDIDVDPVTDNLALYLTSAGRSNGETNPAVWEYENISASLTGFNFTTDGWQRDSEGITALRVMGEARVSIPYKPFGSDFRATGKTIEIEFATRDILDYDTPIISCYTGNRGLLITPQKATLKSEQSEISMQYKEDEHIRLAFVVSKRAGNRLVLIYINGIASGVVQYPDNDDFSQTNPVNISIGASGCTTDIYCIRVYDNDLNRGEILDNWIADTQIGATMLQRYRHNDVIDAYGNVVINKLPADLPYMIIEAEELPQYKGDKKTVKGEYVDPVTNTKSFSFEGCQINVQGTSSAPYARKNYDLQFKNGFDMTMSGNHVDNYALTPNIVPFNRFVLKADVASSESANNVELVKLYCDANPFTRREQVDNPKVRQGIYGFPIVLFWRDANTQTVQFMGKYNFNLPKRAPGPYGYSDNMESWEFQNNTSNLMLFKTDYFDPTMVKDPTTGDEKEAWRYDYEARFPSDEWTNTAKLQELQSFIYSTYRANATGDALESPVTYGTGESAVTYTNDTADYRLAKFKYEFGKYAEVDSFIFYYIFTELFLMVDSRAKNLFIGFSGSDATGTTAIDRKAVAEPYDMDTAIGTNNEGSLVFGYSLEDTDHIEGADVFNGQESVLWNNVRDAFPSEIVQMYQTLRSNGIISFSTVEQRFEEHQAKWPEAIFNEDSWFKYIDPLTNPDPGKDPTAVYLPMMQGSKAEQRKWWLYNRFRYMDSKWNAGDALSDVIQIRGYAKSNVTVTPYADIYPTVKYGSYLVSERGKHGVATTLICPLDNVNDTEIYIYSASQLASVGDLSGFKVGFADFHNATKLQSIKLGDSALGYENPNLKDLTLGNNVLLKTVDVRNCGNLVNPVDMSGCRNLESIYFEGTAVTGVTLPIGGNLKVIHLPGTITNLTIRNHPSLTDLTVDSYDNISTLWLDNIGNTVDMRTALEAIPATSRVRLIGFYWECENVTEIEELYDLLDTMRGLDEHGNNMEKAQVSGTIHTDSLTGEQISAFLARYPYINVTADHTSATLKYYNYDGTQLLNTETVLDGGNGTYSGTPYRSQDAQYTYTFVGWSKQKNQTKADANAVKNVLGDRDVYAAYSTTVRTYTVTFYNGTTLLQTVNNVPYGGTATYTGETPVNPEDASLAFEGWEPSNTNITGDTTCYAKFEDPVEVVEISDSWDTIIANIDNGTYATKYKVGNYKPLDLDTEGTINMQIVAIDKDELADGSGTAPLTFIGMELFINELYMHNTSDNAHDWEDSLVRTKLNTEIYNSLPTSLKQRITSVKKTFKSVKNGSFKLGSVNDKIWIPSARELSAYTSSISQESSGVKYSSIYKDRDLESRKKKPANSDTNRQYWLRSDSKINFSKTYICVIGPDGQIYDIDNMKNRICIGFCLGLEQETIDDSWSDIIASTKDGTYSTKYSVGDTKMLDLGSEGKVLMQLVGIDADEKADGTGTAPTTWISKQLLNTTRVMNTTNTNLNGWPATNLRNYLNGSFLENIPSTVRTNIQQVIKYSYCINPQNTALVSNDYVWIPSKREINQANETAGPIYDQCYPKKGTFPKKKPNGSQNMWCLRSTDWSTGSLRFAAVSYSGSSIYSNANNSSGICIGFCI